MGGMPMGSARASTKRTEDYVNSLPTTLMDAEDGPEPMKNLRPVEKRPTGSDQFWREHGAEYEARASSPPRQCRRADMHNCACPKLRDELDKKRSVSKPKAVSEIRMTQAITKAMKARFYDPKCPKCIREKRAHEKKEKREKERAEKRKNREKKLKSRVSKTKSPKRIRKRQNYFTVNRGCQYFPPKPLGSLSGHIQKCEDENEVANKSLHSNHSVQRNGDKASKSASSNFSKKYPGSSHPSELSYHTYASSLEHEPMVPP